MKIKQDDIPEEDDNELEGQDLEDRKRDYSELKAVKEQLAKLYTYVEKGFDDKNDQNNTIEECWDIYNCVLDTNTHSYIGTSRVFVPIVRDAVNARETRFINMLFPQVNRYADVTGPNGEIPHEIIALLDHYVHTTSLRENIIPAMIRSGDVSGNYDLYVDWSVKTRCVTSKKQVPEVATELGTKVAGSPEYDDVEYEEIKDEGPSIMVLDSRDLLILPATVDDIEDAEVVAVALRYSEAKIKQCIKDGIFEEEPAENLLKIMGQNVKSRHPDPDKKASNAAGVQLDSKGNKRALIYQVWTKLKIKGEHRLMVTHFGGQDIILGCKRNPYWNDRIPVIHQPVEKQAGSIWGASQVAKVKGVQYAANDATNMGFDSAQYALCPIVMTDPEKNPRVGSMVLAMASIWETSPKDTQFATMPQIWKDAFTMVGSCKEQIMQSLGINPAMIPQGATGKRPTQAQVAQEQMVALESTADPIAIIQKPLVKILEWFYDLDYQYRTKDITVRKFGSLGLQADMDQVPPESVRQRLSFRWYGVEGAKTAQQVQQMISWGSTLMQMPPQVLNGRKIDLSPMLEFITEVTCGPRIAPKVLIDQRHQLSMPIELEDQLLAQGFPVQVQPSDDDMMHIQEHYKHFKDLLESNLDITGNVRLHILEHIKQSKEKAAAAAGMQGPPQGMPAPSNTPGAQIQGPTGPQKPPGAVRPDNDPMSVPRKSSY